MARIGGSFSWKSISIDIDIKHALAALLTSGAMPAMLTGEQGTAWVTFRGAYRTLLKLGVKLPDVKVPDGINETQAKRFADVLVMYQHGASDAERRELAELVGADPSKVISLDAVRAAVADRDAARGPLAGRSPEQTTPEQAPEQPKNGATATEPAKGGKAREHRA